LELVVIFCIFALLPTTIEAQTWVPQTSGTTNLLSYVHFIDDNHGWAAGAYQTLLHTENGGTNWASVSSSASEGFYDVRFIDSNVGWVGGQRLIMRTLNAGGSWWIYQFTGVPFHIRHFAVNDSVCWAVGGTLSSRIHWRYVFGSDSVVRSDFWSVGGSDWMRDIFFVDANNGWSVGDPGRIIRITNASSGSPTFTVQTSGTTQSINAIHMLDVSNGWTVGDSGTILKTTDSGTTWNPQTSGTSKKLRDVHFMDQNQGWAVGDSGLIIATTNGGTDWEEENSGVDNELRGVFFVNSGYVVGAGGVILKRASDSIPPDSITDLAATLSGSDVVLDWGQPSDNVGVVGYHIYERTTVHDTGSQLDYVGGATTLTYTVLGVCGNPAINHFYDVRAKDAAENIAAPSNLVGEFDFDSAGP